LRAVKYTPTMSCVAPGEEEEDENILLWMGLFCFEVLIKGDL